MRIAGRFSRIDVPKSPRTAWPRKSTYCTVGVDLHLLVERDDGRPVADLALELGEQAQPLLRIQLAARGRVGRGQLRRIGRPVDERERGPVTQEVVGVEVVARAARAEAAVVRQRAL